MKNENIIQQRRNLYDKAFKEQALHICYFNEIPSETTAKELVISVFDLN